MSFAEDDIIIDVEPAGDGWVTVRLGDLLCFSTAYLTRWHARVRVCVCMGRALSHGN